MALVIAFKNSTVLRAIVLGFIWAAAWASLAVLIGVTIIDPDNSMDEMWFAVGAYPGFLCGIVFCVFFSFATATRKIQGLQHSRIAIVGAAAGLVVGILPFILADASLSGGLTMMAAIVALSTISAVITGALWRSRSN